MKKTDELSRRACAGKLPVLGCAVLFLLFSAGAKADGLQVVPRRLPAAAANLAPIGRLDSGKRLDLVISLPLRDQAGLTNLLRNLYDPSSHQFHQYLTPEQFTERFGPTEQDYQSLAAFAESNGLTLKGTYPNRTLLDVNGTVADIEKALHVTLRTYQHPTEARTFYAPDTDPSISLGVPVLGIVGLSDFYIPRPALSRIARISPGAKIVPGLGSGPGGTYLGFDFRDAYAPGVALTGSGQTLGLFELDGYFPTDIGQYESLAGLPTVPLENVLVDNFNGVPGFNNTEVALDIEMAIAMAPGLSQVIVYEGADSSGDVGDILNRIANDDLVEEISSSWLIRDNANWDPIYNQMAAQGQSFFQCSGDNCAYYPGIPEWADDPFVTIVGGTSLSTTGPGGSYVSETVWNWFSTGAGQAGSGGGISLGYLGNYSIPYWQQGIDMTLNQGSTTQRNVPDVALTADNILVVADNGFLEDVGGTSAATPLWAGFAALVNQQAVEGGQPPIGFLNPALYSIAKGPNYASTFNDITTGNNTNLVSTNLFFAVPGYDLCTGWGTPNGSNLINTLVSPVLAPFFDIVTNVVFGGNNSGLMQYDDCKELNVVLVNGGGAGATAVRATLFTSTPGVAIAQASSPYPDMPIGSTATNLVPFKISTTPAFDCGIPIRLTLLIKCDQTTLVVQLTLPSGVPGAPVRFDNSNPIPIPTTGGTNSIILVSDITNGLNKVTVSLFLSDLYDQSMILQLVSPDGTTNLLSANNGSSGENYGISCAPDSQRTTFDDAGPVPIGAASAPFAGTFQPQQPLAIYFGKSGTNVNGNWRLNVVDQFGIGSAVLECWSLFITPTVCADGGGECPGADLALGMTAQPAPVTQGNNLTYTILVTNLGPSSASNVLVSQLLPSSVVFVSATSSQGSCSPSSGLVTGNLGLMRPGGKASITVVVNCSNSGVISSTATVSSEQPDFNPANNTATVVSVVNPPEADISVSIVGAPSSTVVGGAITYTVTVANNGPNIATLVTVTNSLPAGVSILSATTSQGSLTISNNTVVGNAGTLTDGAQATITINTIATAQGTLVATASASAQQFDPVPANNTSTTTTVVGPAADLALGIIGYPNPVVSGSNLTYVVTVTNLGPSTGQGIVMSATLPVGVTVVSMRTSQGTISINNNVITADLNSLNVSAVATVTIVVTYPSSGVLTTTASVSGSVADPNLANNSAQVSTTVSAPLVSIVPAGAQLTYESFQPPNGSVNPGEMVTVLLSLENIGNISNTNLIATLLATNGVTPTNGTQRTYGVLQPISIPGASPVSQPFTFIASGTNGGTVVATLQLQDVSRSATNNLGTASFVFPLPTLNAFANTNLITIPDHGTATPYPSSITVSGVAGLVSKVTATLSGFTHTYPHDVSALLVGPLGQSTLLISRAGTEPAAGLTLAFDDNGSNGPVLPPSGSGYLTSGDYQPTAYNQATLLMSNPAPAGPYGTNLSTFNGLSPNGTWQLFVLDDTPGDQGVISNGWSLAFTGVAPVNQVADLGVTGVASPNPSLVGGTLTYTFTVTNGGPDTAIFVGFTNSLPANATLISASSSQGNVTTNAAAVFGNLGTLAVGSNATVTVVVSPDAAGTLISTAEVTNGPTVVDLNLANNAVTVTSTAVLPVADVGVTLGASANTVTVGSNLTYTITVTNNGPQNALAVVVSDLVPAAFSVISSGTTLGTMSGSGNQVTCNVGTLAPGSTAVITVSNVALTAAVVTNTANASTASSDTNGANNSASAIVTILNKAPSIVAAGVRLVSKSAGAPDGAIDPGDTVTVSLGLSNIGTANTTNLTATLLAANGVVLSAGPQSYHYGALIAGGPAVSNSFTFTASGTNGGTVTAVLTLQDGANADFAPVSFTFYMPATLTFSNLAGIVIPDHGPGIPYPSAISGISITNSLGAPASVSKATATLYGFAHTFPHDVSTLLVGPAGNNVMLMSHTGGGVAVTNVNLTFNDSAATTLPNNTQLFSGTNRPTSYQGPITLPAAAPSGTYGAALANFNGSNPNGTWSLFVFDDTVGDAGDIVGGWSLTLTVIYPLNSLADLAIGMTSTPTNLYVGGTLVTNVVSVTNLGPAQATGVTVTDGLDQGALVIQTNTTQGTISTSGSELGGFVLTWNVGSLAVGGTATMSVLTAPTLEGTFVSEATVTGNETDLDTANNSAEVTTTIISPTAAKLSGVVINHQLHLTVAAQPNFTYVVQASTNLFGGGSWVPISTNNSSASGTFTITDTNVFKYRFYRAIRVIP